MFMIIKRKQIALFIAMIAVIIVVGFYIKNETDMVSKIEMTMPDNVAENIDQPETAPGEAVMVNAQNNKEDFLTQAKSDREIVRSKALEILSDTIENEAASEKFKEDAETQILQTASDMDTEKKIETLLAAKGYENSVAFISRDVITVTIGMSELSEMDIAKINDIVFEQTGNNNIKIVEVG